MIDITTPAGAFRLTENDVEKDFDGGRIVLVADNGDQAKSPANPAGDALSEDAKITGITVVINYRKDEPMRAWPSLRDDIAKRRFTVRITEEPQA
jgi:hypothetical protein